MLTLRDLNECFDQAVNEGYAFIAVRIRIGLSKEEIIINPRENMKDKQAYYNQAYDDNLRHKFAGDQDISITGFTYADSYAGLQIGIEAYDLTGSTLN